MDSCLCEAVSIASYILIKTDKFSFTHMVSLYNGQNTNVIASSCFSYSDNSLVMNYKKGIGTTKTQTALNLRRKLTTWYMWCTIYFTLW